MLASTALTATALATQLSSDLTATIPFVMHRTYRAITGQLVTCVTLTWSALAIPRSAGLLAQTQSRAARRKERSRVPFVVPSWAFPSPAPATGRPPVLDSVTLLHVPRSRAAFTAVQVRDLFAVVDWHPETHPAMPHVVAHGRKPAVIACGFCHLPNGAGRPENATLAGLPVAYILQQVADMKSGARRSAWRGPYLPSDLMRTIAGNVTDAELAQAARYFSRLRVRQRSRVIETTNIPRPSPSVGLYVPAPGHSMEALGHRLIEMPVDPSRHELRDSGVGYVTYVPPGSIARGRALATMGIRSGVKPCTSCHGPQLRGVGLVPPLAGRAPSYLLRQLLAFKTGTRSTPVSAPMRDVAATLGIDDMIAAAAYAGSRKP